MRPAFRSQLEPGAVRIKDIQLNHPSRDDIPALLIGLPYRSAHMDFRQWRFALRDEYILPGVDRTVGRPGMETWKILVMGVVKQGLGCDFDRLHERVNGHHPLRQFLGHADIWDDEQYEYQTMVDNVCLPQVAGPGQRPDRGERPQGGRKEAGRGDSFVGGTGVHWPTDVSLPWDAMRCRIRTTGRTAIAHGVPGWRQMDHPSESLRKPFHRFRSTRRARPADVKQTLAHCHQRVQRTWETHALLAPLARRPGQVESPGPPAPGRRLAGDPWGGTSGTGGLDEPG